jgi:hypothetical protein
MLICRLLRLIRERQLHYEHVSKSCNQTYDCFDKEKRHDGLRETENGKVSKSVKSTTSLKKRKYRFYSFKHVEYPSLPQTSLHADCRNRGQMWWCLAFRPPLAPASTSMTWQRERVKHKIHHGSREFIWIPMHSYGFLFLWIPMDSYRFL